MDLQTFFSHWDQVHSDLLDVIDCVGEVTLTFAPLESSWLADQIMLHIGEAEEGWFHYVIIRELIRWPDYQFEKFPTRASIKALLSEIHEKTNTLLATWDLADLERLVAFPWSNQQASLGWII